MFKRKSRNRSLKRFLAVALALILALPNLSMGQVHAEESGAAQNSVSIAEEKYVLDTTLDLEAMAAGTKADGEEGKAGTNDFFTILYSQKTKIDGSNKTFEDGYESTQRLNFGGKTDLSVPKNAIRFTTEEKATVKVWWVQGGDDNRPIAILDADENVVEQKDGTYTKNTPYFSSFELGEAGTYYLANPVNTNNFCKIEVIVKKEVVSVPTEYTLDTTLDLEAMAAGTKADGEEGKAGTNDFFTILYSQKTKIDGSNKTFEDGYESTQRLNFGGKTDLSVPKNAIRFTTEGKATVKVWWVQGGDDNRPIAILDADENVVEQKDGTYTKNTPYFSSFELGEAGTYYLANPVNTNNFCKISVIVEGSGETPEKPPRADWATVETPVITDVQADGKDVEVTVSANVGYDGADSVTVTMYDAEGTELASKKSSAEKTEHVMTFTPGKSGTYTFKAVLSREEQEDKVSAENKEFAFVLPLGKPSVSSVTCNGGGAVTVVWSPVDEAESYYVFAEGTDIANTVTETSAVLEGLEIGKTFTFSVMAVRGEEKSEAGSKDWTVVGEKQRAWPFSVYGCSSINTDNNKSSGNVYEDTLTVESTGGKGKLVANSVDGIAFCYTEIDPETENFTLSADITVDEWTYSNGQEGFGMMAADAVGKHGDKTDFWNNSYMLSVTKVEYKWDAAAGEVSDAGTGYTMKLGIGAQEKKGITAENLKEFAADSTTAVKKYFTSKMYTLESSAGKAGKAAGTYNIVGNYTKDPGGSMEPLTTTFHMEIQRNNTGYFLTYTDAEGNSTVKKFYHGDDGDELTKIDKDSIYVGFFAARNAKISVKNVNLTTIAPEDDEPAEGRPLEKVTPNYSVESAGISNSAAYDLVYYGNADGRLTVEGAKGAIVSEQEVTALTKVHIPVMLEKGVNNYKVTFTPNPDYKPSEYQVMENYDTASFDFSVEYKVNAGANIYIGPTGTAQGDGTKEKPLDIYTAVKYAAPGQKLFLMEGTYSLTSTVVTERGLDGTAEQMIYLAADPAAATRPVLDFNEACAGMVLAGDYWYFQGFDVTKSAPGQKGIQVSGNHNTLDRIYAYENGNTGIQISRYRGTDLKEDWPSYNLVLNCTSYLNADPGYEDADGFAAKLTVSDGNVFDGCISAYNADDGWDLYAKVETGAIGSVTIRNCVTFKNGYDLIEKDGVYEEIPAGNGNGFKMGGENLPGGHLLENSIAFANRAKGFDSNSCPDIQVKNSISFNNESYNVALYTNTAADTDYSAEGIISFKDDKGNTTGESIKPKGTQDLTKIYGESNYYFPDGNASGVKAEASWFEKLDIAGAMKDGIARNADGTINMNGYFVLTEAAPEDAGARMTGIASPEIKETVVDNGNTGNNGNNETGGSTDTDDDDEEEDDDDQDSGSDNSGSSQTENSNTTGSTNNAGSSNTSGNKKPAGGSKPVEPTKPAETPKPTEKPAETAKPTEKPAETPAPTEKPDDIVVVSPEGIEDTQETGNNIWIPIACIAVAVIVIAGAGIYFMKKKEMEKE